MLEASQSTRTSECSGAIGYLTQDAGLEVSLAQSGDRPRKMRSIRPFFICLAGVLLLTLQAPFAHSDGALVHGQKPARKTPPASSPVRASGTPATNPEKDARPSEPPVPESGLAIPSVTPGEPNSITFVQITDAHLFDSRKKKEDIDRKKVESELQDTWTAFRWALQRINVLVESGRPIDFVAFTGDFGLELVWEQGESTSVKGSCITQDDIDAFQNLKQLQPWRKFYTPAEAAQTVAAELRKLKVKIVYLVPGNNDLVGEKPCDLRRYQNFVKIVAAATAGSPQVVDLSSSTMATPKHGPFQLLGLNSASFKFSKNYDSICDEHDSSKTPQRDSGCPTFEIEELNRKVSTARGTPSIIFTHIPDLMDPFEVKGGANPANHMNCKKLNTHEPQWECDSWSDFKDKKKDEDKDKPPPPPNHFPQRNLWVQTVTMPQVIGIFAAHFHDPDRPNYATMASETDLYNGIDVARKTWVAPPLALKNQEKKPNDRERARGFLLVRVQAMNKTATGASAPEGANSVGAVVSVIPFWYEATPDCSCFVIVGVLAGLAVVALIVFWVTRLRVLVGR